MQDIDTLVGPGSHLTLRYRVSLPDGSEAVSTFGMNPATLSLGAGQLAETLDIEFPNRLLVYGEELCWK